MLNIDQIDSQHLADNLMGDPSLRDLVVYLPPSYHTSSRRYPTAYLLHGFGMQARSWTEAIDFGGWLFQPIDQVLDPVMTKQPATEMIVIMPDGWSKYGCSQWVDSSVNGNFEQYITQEVINYIDGHYRTIPSRDSRGIFGISSGGFGAWHLSSRHPDLFSAMALLSADSYFEMTLKPLFLKFYNDIYPQEPTGPVEGNGLSTMLYGLATCYSPNLAKPPYYSDLPIAFPTGDVLQPIWEKWLSYDPVVNWVSRVDNLRQLRGILLDVGCKDEYNLHYGHRQLSRSLASVGIKHRVEEHQGNHVGRLYERIQFAIQWLSETLEFDNHIN
jgi:S-formylglutathione hydrolase FrmB